MKQQWAQINDKFSQLSAREMALIFLSGLVICIMLPFSFSIEKNLAAIKADEIKIAKTTKSNKDLERNINELSLALKSDPNKVLKGQISQLEKRLTAVDKQLLTLTEELINPIEMRQALIKLLKLQKGVSLLSFEVIPAHPLIFSVNDEAVEVSKQAEKNDVLVANKRIPSGLYKHAVQIKLSGKYFQLRDYLQQLEDLPWKFFWHKFNYELKEYPVSELKIEIYSLSTNQEFIGV